MLVDLVQTTTRDGIRLDGMFQLPTAPASPAIALDVVCFVHGTGGNFYSSTLFDELANRFLELGIAVLRINTRGHDLMSTAATPRGGRRAGAAYEVADECRQDLAAWIDWLGQWDWMPARKGAAPRIGLVGHSLGAVKCLYALAKEPGLPVQCVVALSPPRLSYSWFRTSPEGPAFLDTYTLAEANVQEGMPGALLEVKLPLPFVITAAGYVEKYGPEERYNYLRFVADVPCPALLTLGSVEAANNMAFRGAADALAALGNQQGRRTVAMIPGADHFYSGVRGELLACLEGWLRNAPR